MSLRLRLLIVAGVATAIALVLSGIITYFVFSNYIYDGIDSQMTNAAVPIVNMLNSTGFVSVNQIDRIAPGMMVEILNSFGQPISQLVAAYIPGGNLSYSPKLPTNLPLAKGSGQPIEFFTVPSVKSGGPPFRVATTPLTNGDYLLIADPIGATKSALSHIVFAEIAIISGCLIIAVLLGIWLIGLGLKPLNLIKNTAAQISRGDISKRIQNVKENTEIGQLAVVLNEMLDKIEHAFNIRDDTERRLRFNQDQMKQFIADASHELRTPLAAVSAYSELFEMGAKNSPEDLGRAMKGIRAETSRMKALVEDLLLLAHLDEGQQLEKEPVELNAVLEEAVKAANLISPEHHFEFSNTIKAYILADRLKIRQVFDNLFSNVINYTPPNTTCRANIEVANEVIVVEITDDGPGVEPSLLPDIFKRFVRGSTGRERSSGGGGLGLSIVSSILDAHNAEITAFHVEPHGLGFRITFKALEL
jgi:two-component system OmpR family sensor kinase